MCWDRHSGTNDARTMGCVLRACRKHRTRYRSVEGRPGTCIILHRPVQDAFGLGESTGIKNKPIFLLVSLFVLFKTQGLFCFLFCERGSMSSGSSQQEADYAVVVNQEGQYSVWPINKIVPNGWFTAGRQGSKASCLAFIDGAWTDMRPRSLQARTHPG